MLLKRTARTVIDRAAAGAGLLALRERRMLEGLTILMYHRVLPAQRCAGYPLASLVMEADAFRSQVGWLAAHCDVRPVSEALRELRRTNDRRRPLVSITFDDGYSDNAEIAAPILEEHGVRGTFFVTTGFVESGQPLWFDRAADAWTRLEPDQRLELLGRVERAGAGADGGAAVSLPRWMAALKTMTCAARANMIEAVEELAEGDFESRTYSPMSSDQVRGLCARGHEVASHTVTHPILPLLSDTDLADELARSGETIRNWTGADELGFCYPNGDFDERVEGAVRRAGYSYACTTRGGLNRADASTTQLARVDITRHRVLNHRGVYDEIAFRSEVCRLREWWRFSNGVGQ